MRPCGAIRYYPGFPRAIPGEGAGSPRVTQPFATRFRPKAGAVRLACVRRAASVHPEPGSNSPSNMEPAMRPVASLIGAREPARFRLTPKSRRIHRSHRRPERNRVPTLLLSLIVSGRWCLLCLLWDTGALCPVSSRDIRFSRCPPRPPPWGAARAARRYIATRRGRAQGGIRRPRFLHNSVVLTTTCCVVVTLVYKLLPLADAKCFASPHWTICSRTFRARSRLAQARSLRPTGRRASPRPGR